MPGLESGREEVIAAGTVIIRTIMDELRVDRCLVSEYGLREGILVDLAERMGGSG
jgi:exopolyphosphatase/guanosine-5'-triphosphate,3'-diphosphate pyrophosphatase